MNAQSNIIGKDEESRVGSLLFLSITGRAETYLLHIKALQAYANQGVEVLFKFHMYGYFIFTFR